MEGGKEQTLPISEESCLKRSEERRRQHEEASTPQTYGKKFCLHANKIAKKGWIRSRSSF